MEKIDSKLRKQYEDIIYAIESEGLEYSIVHGGYIKPNTDNEDLNNAIILAKKSLEKIEEIINPYRID